MIRWIAAFIGYALLRFPGAILGFLIGSFIDQFQKGDSGGIYTTSRRVSSQDFEVHLLSLCALVIKADGQVSDTERHYVQQYFIRTYGPARANHIFKTFNSAVDKKELNAQKICFELNTMVSYPMRLQLLHFLFSIANSDGGIHPKELERLTEIASYLKIKTLDFRSIKAMFVVSTTSSYEILEIRKSATDAEVKKAYRDMAKKYHPDRVNTEDEAIKKGAEEKFKQVQQAYEAICKERGL
jgi:DnaJ like chaperone protein